MENTKSNYNFKNWGECINQLRTKLNIPVITLCTECKISARTYYEVRSGLIPESAIISGSSTICTTSS